MNITVIKVMTWHTQETKRFRNSANSCTAVADSVARIYSGDVAPSMLGLPEAEVHSAKPEDCRFEKTYLWTAVTRMYDYGVAGIDNGGIGYPLQVEDYYADAEMFFVGLPYMALYLNEDQVRLPFKAMRAVQTAVARHVLEGGERYTTLDPLALEGAPMSGEVTSHLSIKEVAFLADMDERSVRNACNPKLAGHLETVSVGKRSLVEPSAAKRWLSTRKGYVPLQQRASDASSARVSGEVTTIELPEALLRQLRAKATSGGVSLNEYLSSLV